MDSPTIGFIILRHVNSKSQDQHWIKSYNSVRKYYPENPVVIMDDNSNEEFVTPLKLYNTTIINSEYPKRGELLPYFYYLRYNWFDIAVIIHDSVFINSNIDLNVEKYKFLWEFDHASDSVVEETKMINLFNDDELSNFYNNKQLWKGCYGGMSIITHDFLTHVNNKYNLSILLDYIINRTNRMCFERVFGCILQKEAPRQTLLGDIHQYCFWGLSITEIDVYKDLPIIKVWGGR